MEKNLVRNLRYGPQTWLVRGINDNDNNDNNNNANDNDNDIFINREPTSHKVVLRIYIEMGVGSVLRTVCIV